MCGIFAWAGNNSKLFNNYKFTLLGVFNDDRGGHSCGVYHNGDIAIGVDQLKLFKNFITEYPRFDPGKQPIVIGHTRMATSGIHNEYNAHPFGFGKPIDDEIRHTFTGVHNGTLVDYSIKEIAEKYGVELTAKRKTANGYITRNKIDSEILLECIYKSDSFKVLEYYKGAAALVFSDNRYPNVCYFYHGKSYKDSHDYQNKKQETIVEERPLFYYQEGPNSLYVSSMKESLQAITMDDDFSKIGEFEHNVVYKVTDGDLSKAVKFKIDRSDCYQKHFGTKNKSSEDVKNNTTTVHTYSSRNSFKNRNNNRGKKRKLKDMFENGELLNIHDEPSVKQQNEYKGSVYFKALRFWANGHLIEGIYSYIKNKYYKLGDNLDETIRFINNHVGLEFHNGEFIKDKKIKFTKETSFIPFKEKVDDEDNLPKNLHYFFEGCKIKTLLDYRMVRFGNKKFNIIELSECTTHPIINLNSRSFDINKQQAYKSGELYTGRFSDLGAERNYVFENGNLVDYTLCNKLIRLNEIKDKKCDLPSDDHDDIPYMEAMSQVKLLKPGDERPNDKSLVDNERINKDIEESIIDQELDEKSRLNNMEEEMWNIMQDVHNSINSFDEELNEFKDHPNYESFSNTLKQIKQHIYSHNFGED